MGKIYILVSPNNFSVSSCLETHKFVNQTSPPDSSHPLHPDQTSVHGGPRTSTALNSNTTSCSATWKWASLSSTFTSLNQMPVETGRNFLSNVTSQFILFWFISSQELLFFETSLASSRKGVAQYMHDKQRIHSLRYLAIVNCSQIQGWPDHACSDLC